MLEIDNISHSYSLKETLKNISFNVEPANLCCITGPSGCGKTTLLRIIAGLQELQSGQVKLDNITLATSHFNCPPEKRNIGMVFQRPNLFPKSIYDNVGYGVRLHYQPKREELDKIVEKSLRRAAIWDEVSDRLHDLGTSLSGGQQQRLCIARTIAIEPDIILMDEPCSALDPIATAAIEELILELKKDFTVVIVTHSMSQAARVSDYTGFMYIGRMVEFGKTDKIFSDPDQDLTKRYITGRFG